MWSVGQAFCDRDCATGFRRTQSRKLTSGQSKGARDAYFPHPEHRRVIRDYIAPILRQMQVFDCALDG